MDIFSILFYQPIYNVLIVLYRLFSENLGLAIIVVAILSRLITLPITLRQIEMGEKNQKLSQDLKAIQEKYKDDKQKQTEEMAKMQSQFMTGMLGGCLPLIVQFIFLINILNVIRNIFEQGVAGFNQVAYPFVATFAEGQVISPNFLGIDLNLSANHFGFSDLSVVWPYVALALLVGVSQYVSSKIMMGMKKNKDLKSEEVKESDTKRKKKKKKVEEAAKPEDFGEIMQKTTKQMLLLFPILITFSSLSFPAGLSLYWTVQSAFVIIQQFIVDRVIKK